MNDIELIHGDCLIEMQKIPDGSIDAVICDLPYGVLNRSNRSAKWDSVIPLDKLWEHYRRIVKENGAIVLFAQGMFTARLMMSNPDMWRYNLIWDKINRPTGFLDANRKPLRIHEDICVFYRSQPTYNPQFTYGSVNHSRGKPGNAIGGGQERMLREFQKDGDRHYKREIPQFHCPYTEGTPELPAQHTEACGIGRVACQDLYERRRTCIGQHRRQHDDSHSLYQYEQELHWL